MLKKFLLLGSLIFVLAPLRVSATEPGPVKHLAMGTIYACLSAIPTIFGSSMVINAFDGCDRRGELWHVAEVATGVLLVVAGIWPGVRSLNSYVSFLHGPLSD